MRFLTLACYVAPRLVRSYELQCFFKGGYAAQFYTEVMDSVQTLDTGRRSAYDPDELDEEQREREQRNKARSFGCHVGRTLCRLVELHCKVSDSQVIQFPQPISACCATKHVPLPRRSTRCTSPSSSE